MMIIDTYSARIASVAAAEGRSVRASWAEGRHAGMTCVIDLTPEILTHKIYRPLRANAELFGAVRVVAEGSAIAWGEPGAIEMTAATLERLVSEAMTPADFSAFLARNRLTLDAAASQLGVSRRLVAYYAKERSVPRHIALACAYIDSRMRTDAMAEARAAPFPRQWAAE
jgi:hypothetical protein